MNKALTVGKGYLKALIVPLILFIVLYFTSSATNLGTLASVMRQSIASAVLSIGLLYGLIIGIWNFSVGAVVMFAAIFGGNLALQLNLSVFPTVILIIFVGTFVGLITGALFIFLRIPSVILTIGMMLIMESATAVSFGGGGVVMQNDILKLTLFPYDVIIGLVIFVIAYILLYKNSFGYNLRAIGGNIGAAKLNGIRIDLVRILCLMATGFFCGCYAFIAIAKSGVITPRVNMDSLAITFDCLICAFIALSLRKNINLIAGVYIGSLSVQLIKNCILAIGLPSVFQQAIVAILLAIFIILDSESDFVNSVKDLVNKKLKPVKA